MNAHQLRSLSYDDLRARLEALHAQEGLPDELRRLLHELEIHQVELEMQNRELRETRQALEENLERYAALYDGAPVGYVTLLADGSIRELNLTAAALIGRERQRLIGGLLANWLAPEDRPRLRTFLRQQVESGASVVLRLCPERGEERHIRLQALWALDSDKSCQVCRAAMIDVTEQERAHAALREADHAKDNFLMLLAHELRNPLAPVRSAAEILLARPGGPEARKAAEMIGRQAVHMTRLVDDLLDVSRITHGSISLRKSNLDLCEAVQQAVEQARPQCEQWGQPITVELPPEPVWVDGDAARLAQIVVNLLTNACKFSPPDAPVELKLETVGSEARLSVRDQGIGIPQELQARIFEPFVQAERSEERAPGGLGLGLTLAQGLARMHGGRLEVASAGRGRGSTFTLSLPRVPQAAAAAAAPPAAEPAAEPGESLSILIVDDNRDVSESTTMLLELAGHHAEAAADGPAALRTAETLNPDVILLDIGLPGMDGFEVARRLRAIPAGSRAIILAVSGYDLASRPGQGDTSLFDGSLLKPVGLKTLLATIEACRRAG